MPDDTVAAIRRGHPWVWRDRAYRVERGVAVVLTDDRDREIGWGLADEGAIAVRVFGRDKLPDDVGRAIGDRLARAERLRARMAPPDTDCWRVCNGEGDGLPGLVVDRYADLAVVRLYGACWEPWLDGLVETIRAFPWVERIYRRLGVVRVDGGDGGVELVGETPDALVVREYGMSLLVRPKVGQKTGLFLDQREHRFQVRRWSSGRRVANLFCYNGGFSVAAALGGAAHVISVDQASDAIDDARENFRLNGLDPAAHTFEVADVFHWSPKGHLDLLVVDPPSLAHDKTGIEAAKKAYRKLHARLGPFVARDGLLATSSCTARLDLDTWRNEVARGLEGDWSWHACSTEPPDHPTALAHPEARYLKFALLRRR